MDKYINIKVLSPDAQIVGENDITIRDPKPSNKINTANKNTFLLSNSMYKEIIIDVHTKNKTISGTHVLGEKDSPVPYCVMAFFIATNTGYSSQKIFVKNPNIRLLASGTIAMNEYIVFRNFELTQKNKISENIKNTKLGFIINSNNVEETPISIFLKRLIPLYSGNQFTTSAAFLLAFPGQVSIKIIIAKFKTVPAIKKQLIFLSR